MTRPDKPIVLYEDAAEHRTGIEGWVCKTCRRYWAADEHMARWCCATNLPCKECGGRNTYKGYTCCQACRYRHEEERWAKLERVEWDGETPVCKWMDDRYYFDADALADAIADHVDDGGSLETFRLVLCRPVEPRSFEMADFLADDLPEDFDPGKDFDEIDKVVNDWIAARMPFSWEPTNQAISIESLRPYLPDLERP